ncbi:hypothetical protein DSL72_002411 [Monilinia vaccinii-corymbosi]|uniref:Uncharacterized protein n=1 Tax=Monilinia vaccinii-corymbosi TaxID=61207 RepID=A0A8A3PCM3_9HELO|nr:hypothetical protein DSL72_002411 [Monilinia vaccinii-corymbosi]
MHPIKQIFVGAILWDDPMVKKEAIRLLDMPIKAFTEFYNGRIAEIMRAFDITMEEFEDRERGYGAKSFFRSLGKNYKPKDADDEFLPEESEYDDEETQQAFPLQIQQPLQSEKEPQSAPLPQTQPEQNQPERNPKTPKQGTKRKLSPSSPAQHTPEQDPSARTPPRQNSKRKLGNTH